MPVVILEKDDASNFTSSFNVGEHIIGRGPNLLCNSKKVSRNHGVLKLTEHSEVFLRSTHNNPCFYQRSNSTYISVVSFGNTIQIHNDDKIALSLDHGWFKVLIKDLVNVVDNATRPNSSIESVIDKTTVNTEKLSNKREHDESDETVSKRLKVIELDSVQSAQTDVEVQNIVPTESEQDRNTIRKPIENTRNSGVQNNDNHEDIPESEIKIEPVDTHSNINVDMQSGSGTVINESGVTIKTEPVEDLVQTINYDPAKPKISANNSESAIKDNSAEDLIQSNEDGPDRRINTSNSQSATKEDASLPTGTDKTSGKDETDPENVKDVENNNTDDSCKKPEIKDEPSTSGTNRPVWRDKCWYGSSCYRKNASHRTELKHPGDSDYDSDSNDARPICCYGVDCYRKNKEHRRRFRHPGQKKIGTKPASARKRRKVKVKNTSPLNSDLDDSYDDSFIDDGCSSDEYEPSGESDTESEYDDEDNSQNDDRQLLQREAKQFIRKK